METDHGERLKQKVKEGAEVGHSISNQPHLYTHYYLLCGCGCGIIELNNMGEIPFVGSCGKWV